MVQKGHHPLRGHNSLEINSLGVRGAWEEHGRVHNHKIIISALTMALLRCLTGHINWWSRVSSMG